MLIEQTVDKMNAMKLSGMAEALKQLLGSSGHAELSFDERLGLLVDAEWIAREQRKLTKRLRSAKLRYAASLEDVDFKHPRTLDRQQVLSLGNCGFVENHHNLLIIGPTGIGKSYLACAFVERACRRGYKSAYDDCRACFSRSPWPVAMGRTRASSSDWRSSISSRSTTGCWHLCATTNGATSSRSSRTAASGPRR